MRFNLTNVGDFEVSEANEEMSGSSDLNLQFWVETTDGTTEMAAELDLTDIAFKFTALVNDMDIALNVT